MTEWAGIDGPAPAGDPVTGRRGTPAAPPQRLPRPDPRPVVGSVDGGARLFQRNARTFVLGSAVFIAPVVVLNVVAASLAYDRFDSVDGAVVSVPELAGGAAGTTGVEHLLQLLGVYLGGLAVALAGGFAGEVVARARLGEPPGFAAALGATARRLPSLAVAWLLGHAWMLAASPVVVLAGRRAALLAAIGLSPLLGLLTVCTLYVSPVIVAEGVGPLRGLRRAFRLARLRFGTAIGLAVVSGLVGLWVRFGITWLPRLVEAVGLVELGRFGWLLEGVAGQLGLLVSVPVVAAATAWGYLEVRLRAEGLDLALELRAVAP